MWLAWAVPPAAESASAVASERLSFENMSVSWFGPGKTGVLISLGDFVFVTRPLFLDCRPSARPFARRLSVRPTPRRDVLDRRVPPDRLRVQAHELEDLRRHVGLHLEADLLRDLERDRVSRADPPGPARHAGTSRSRQRPAR